MPFVTSALWSVATAALWTLQSIACESILGNARSTQFRPQLGGVICHVAMRVFFARHSAGQQHQRRQQVDAARCAARAGEQEWMVAVGEAQGALARPTKRCLSIMLVVRTLSDIFQ
jgi:hypothetical protein